MKHAIILLVLFALCGTGAVVAGIYLLAGTGFALLALGFLLFGAAFLLSRGISRG